ncbi:hypothetical protein EIP91_001222 [Steccherinum ochraceum]|uniref:G-patch domain-containing protein n=1 Tax=Steccherinum ochraceum TaxID=92696 RepID=A0A4R0RTX2_9APHY|nr:hypothetical protein EIP91_001222 [Steccherinum ochraceum]
MPLDGHAYLVSQGWEGRGTGLRQGAIAKPVTLVQKKTLSGVGKDRDDAFPFWDHVFSAAASAIKIKTSDTDDESDSSDTPATTISLKRTTTGIISNRRPLTGTPALLSENATPGSSGSSTPTPRISILAAAKQEAARRTLYSMFFRGPVMRSDDTTPTPTKEEAKAKKEAVDEVVEAVTERLGRVEKAKKEKERSKSKKDKGKEKEREKDQDPSKTKKRKKDKSSKEVNGELKEEKRERKRRKLEVEEGLSAPGPVMIEETDTKAAKAERKRLRGEKRARKEEKRQRKEAQAEEESEVEGSESQRVSAHDVRLPTSSSPARTVTTASLVAADSDASDPKRRKKKRKTG